MGMVRNFLVVLFVVAIPVQGIAGTVMATIPALMEDGLSVEVMDSHTAHDCCDDVDAPAKSGKVCKMGSECQCEGQYLPYTPTMHSLRPVVTDRFSPFESFIHTLTAAGVWRPPIQL